MKWYELAALHRRIRPLLAAGLAGSDIDILGIERMLGNVHAQRLIRVMSDEFIGMPVAIVG